MSAPSEAPKNTELAWRIVGLANAYRLLAAPALLITYALTGPVPVFGATEPRLFVLTAWCQILAGLALLFAGRRRWPSRRRLLVFTHAGVDVGAVALLLYSSGGVASGLAILLVIPVAAMALLAEGRDAFLMAAMAALGILGQQIVAQLSGLAPAADYPLAGIMGIVVFLIALSALPVANRLRESEALVHRQELDLANLAQLSQYIVQHLRESILVCDPSDRIRLINESAAHLLGDERAVPGALLGEVSPRLLYLLTTWRQLPRQAESAPGTLVGADGSRLIEPHFAPLGADEPAPVLIFLEDTGALASKVQQTKLAALGRLSASIAHEIRNPVGAMSHAAQLLAESHGLTEEDVRLTEIMRTNANRVSGIIDNVLKLSRRELPHPERISLVEWCQSFRTEFCSTMECAPEQLGIVAEDENLEVDIDPDQLHQILWNLCQNALIHGRKAGASEPVQISIGRLGSAGRPFLDVADRGPGVAAEDIERVFEPFFTRGARGTGLGLFLARELAESNGAALIYEPREGGGSCFRIVFSDPSRWASAYLSGEPGR
jgi:two-component system sensor histidine kinase PilS (NtrC family)